MVQQLQTSKAKLVLRVPGRAALTAVIRRMLGRRFFDRFRSQPAIPRPVWRSAANSTNFQERNLRTFLQKGLFRGVFHKGFGLTQSSVRPKQLDPVIATASNALRLQGDQGLQDFLAALVLSECVYKKVEMSWEDLTNKLNQIMSQFPPGIVQLDEIQCSLSTIPHNYILATGPGTLYVAFMGTKEPRDLAADMNFILDDMWTDPRHLFGKQVQGIPSAHRGFLARANSINIEHLYRLAQSSGRRLVLCGHSLGGSVATLSAVHLLRQLPERPAPQLRCISFAAPAVGNAALADLIKVAGWQDYFRNYFLPEDTVMRVVSWAQQAGEPYRQVLKRQVPKAVPAAASLPAASTADTPPAAVTEQVSMEALQEEAASELALLSRDDYDGNALLSIRAEAMLEEARRQQTGTSNGKPAALAVADTVSPRDNDRYNPPPTAFGLTADAQSPDAPRAVAPPRDLDVGTPSPVVKQMVNLDHVEEEETVITDVTPPGVAADTLQSRSSWARLLTAVSAQQRWGVDQLLGLARIAHGGLTSATQVVTKARCVPFGQQWFMSLGGVHSPDEIMRSPKPIDLMSPAEIGLPGPFAFHRMIAYRGRVMQLMSSAVGSAWEQLPKAPSSSPQQARLSSTLFPEIQAMAASAWVPLVAGPVPSSPTVSSSASSGTPAAVGTDQVKDGSAKIGGSNGGAASKSTRSNMVAMMMRVEGKNLLHCRLVAVKAFGQQYTAEDVVHRKSPATPESATDPPSMLANELDKRLLQRLVHTARQGAETFAAVAATFLRRLGSQHPVPAKVDESCSMIVRIQLPRSVAQKLQSQDLSSPGADGSPLTLYLKSDCHEVSMPVVLQPHRVAVLGQSKMATALVHAALTGQLGLPLKLVNSESFLPAWLAQPTWISGLRRAASLPLLPNIKSLRRQQLWELLPPLAAVPATLETKPRNEGVVLRPSAVQLPKAVAAEAAQDSQLPNPVAAAAAIAAAATMAAHPSAVVATAKAVTRAAPAVAAARMLVNHGSKSAQSSRAEQAAEESSARSPGRSPATAAWQAAVPGRIARMATQLVRRPAADPMDDSMRFAATSDGQLQAAGGSRGQLSAMTLPQAPPLRDEPVQPFLDAPVRPARKAVTSKQKATVVLRAPQVTQDGGSNDGRVTLPPRRVLEQLPYVEHPPLRASSETAATLVQQRPRLSAAATDVAADAESGRPVPNMAASSSAPQPPAAGQRVVRPSRSRPRLFGMGRAAQAKADMLRSGRTVAGVTFHNAMAGDVTFQDAGKHISDRLSQQSLHSQPLAASWWLNAWMAVRSQVGSSVIPGAFNVAGRLLLALPNAWQYTFNQVADNASASHLHAMVLVFAVGPGLAAALEAPELERLLEQAKAADVAVVPTLLAALDDDEGDVFAAQCLVSRACGVALGSEAVLRVPRSILAMDAGHAATLLPQLPQQQRARTEQDISLLWRLLSHQLLVKQQQLIGFIPGHAPRAKL